MRYLALILTLLASPAAAQEWRGALGVVKERLRTEEKMDAQTLRPLDSPWVRYNGRAVEAKLLDILRSPPAFTDYTDPASVQKTRKFLVTHEKTFSIAENESTPERSVVAAVLMVETRLGNYKGRFPTLPVLASLAALSVPEFRKGVVSRLVAEAGKRFPDADSVDWEKRASDIGERWVGELTAFLRLARILKWNVHAVKGSWAGALGYGQFMPATVFRLVATFEKAWLPNLWTWDDTIRLTARHLREDGWTAEIKDEQAREAVKKYNGRQAYADAVLKLAALVD